MLLHLCSSYTYVYVCTIAPENSNTSLYVSLTVVIKLFCWFHLKVDPLVFIANYSSYWKRWNIIHIVTLSSAIFSSDISASNLFLHSYSNQRLSLSHNPLWPGWRERPIDLRCLSVCAACVSWGTALSSLEENTKQIRAEKYVRDRCQPLPIRSPPFHQAQTICKVTLTNSKL